MRKKQNFLRKINKNLFIHFFVSTLLTIIQKSNNSWVVEDILTFDSSYFSYISESCPSFLMTTTGNQLYPCVIPYQWSEEGFNYLFISIDVTSKTYKIIKSIPNELIDNGDLNPEVTGIAYNSINNIMYIRFLNGDFFGISNAHSKSTSTGWDMEDLNAYTPNADDAYFMNFGNNILKGASTIAYNPTNQTMCTFGYWKEIAVKTSGSDWCNKTAEVTGDFIAFSSIEYRSDLQKFLAFSKLDKLFYVSVNGWNWTKLYTTKVPLNNISSYAYNPNTGEYCVLGESSNTSHVAFSTDLENWTIEKVCDYSFYGGTRRVIYSAIWNSYIYTDADGNIYELECDNS